MQRYPLVLDTDIGDDIDDALALALALNSPEIELRGVTTVFRDAPRRTILVKQLLNLMNRSDIPVAAGTSIPLLQPWSAIPHGGANLGKQFEALGPNALPESGPHAIEFLVGQIHLAASQGQRLTIAAIGPLTNIALLFSVYPEVVTLCDLLIMGGKWSEAYPEWNIVCDPEAAAMVFSSGASITMVGLDVTLQCVLSDSQVADFSTANKPHTLFLADLIALWAHPITLHDPLTLLVLF
ncbi:MAG TPA: nucleoside hydrolase, partial [Abditibacteriaceae bacterium]